MPRRKSDLNTIYISERRRNICARRQPETLMQLKP